MTAQREVTRSPYPEHSITGAIAFLREAWRGNDGAEGESVKLVCNELERLRALDLGRTDAWISVFAEQLRERIDHIPDSAFASPYDSGKRFAFEAALAMLNKLLPAPPRSET